MGLSSIASFLGRNISRVASKGASAVRNAGGVRGIASTAGSALARNPDAVLAGVSLLQGASQQRGADRLEGEALARAQSLFAERAPLRRLALERLQRPRTVRPVREVFDDPSNPYG